MISKQDLIGTWQLESWTVGYSDREDFTTPFGEDPKGLLLYTEDDWRSASIARSDRQTLPQDIPFRKIPEEKLAQAYLSYFHYAGRYRVVEGDVVHYVTQSLNPKLRRPSGRQRPREAGGSGVQGPNLNLRSLR